MYFEYIFKSETKTTYLRCNAIAIIATLDFTYVANKKEKNTQCVLHTIIVLETMSINVSLWPWYWFSFEILTNKCLYHGTAANTMFCILRLSNYGFILCMYLMRVILLIFALYMKNHVNQMDIFESNEWDGIITLA